jgi:hypothetical protein
MIGPYTRTASRILPALSFLICATGLLAADAPKPATQPVTKIEVEKAPQRVTIEGGLGTRSYIPSADERPFFDKTPGNEQAIGSLVEDSGYDLSTHKGRWVSWFGIVRSVQKIDGDCELLVEHKYFDGLTDLHILALSFSGAGDFKVIVHGSAEPDIHPLQLIRVYGKVSEEEVQSPPPATHVEEKPKPAEKPKGKPGRPDRAARPAARPDEPAKAPSTVHAEYVRVFPWKTFTFIAAYGRDRTNPTWRKLCKVPADAIYSPVPDDAYYRDRLGDPNDAGKEKTTP